MDDILAGKMKSLVIRPKRPFTASSDNQSFVFDVQPSELEVSRPEIIDLPEQLPIENL